MKVLSETDRKNRPKGGRTPLAALTSLLLLAGQGCASPTPMRTHEAWLANRDLPLPTQDAFINCSGNGCRHRTMLALAQEDKADLDKLFSPPSRTASRERERIEQAIGLLERRTGAITGTIDDVAGTFGSFGPHQTDCVDEATNTTVYLALLAQRHLLLFHTIRGPAVRLPLLSGTGWPHTTAVVTENATGKDFAVDSWFEDGGKPAHIVPLDEWMRGWSP